MNDSQKEAFWRHSLKMRKCWYPAFVPFFTMFSTPVRDQSHSLIHILFVLCRRFTLMSFKFYCLVIHISHKTLEIGCAWSKGSGERLQGHHVPLVCLAICHSVPSWYLNAKCDERWNHCKINFLLILRCNFNYRNWLMAESRIILTMCSAIEISYEENVE